MGRRRGSRLRPYDFIAIGAAVAVTAVSALSVYASAFGGADEARVVIEAGGRSWVYPMNAEETLKVGGPLGDTVVEISGGWARVVSSPCKNQICVAAGHIHSPNQWVACLPNAVFVRIEGTKHAEALDAATW